MHRMRVELREVEFACDQEDHSTDRAEPPVAARLAPGGLEQSVQRPQIAATRCQRSPMRRATAANGISRANISTSASKSSVKPESFRLDLAHRATRQLHARHADLQVALVLDEVEVPITLAERIVHWMDAILFRHGEPATGGEIDAYGQGLCRRVQVNRCHMPRLGNAQDRLK